MKDVKQKILLAFVAVLLLTGIVWWKEQEGAVLSETGQLERLENGKGEYEAELVLTVDENTEMEWIVIVPEQKLTKQEEEMFLAAAIEEIEGEFAGANTSLEEIVNAVVIRESYQNGIVLAEWEFSNHGLIDEDGSIVEEVMEKDTETVGAKVFLACEDSSIIYDFYFSVCKREKSREEQFYEELNQFISENGKEEGTKILRLPTELEGHKLEWKNKKSRLPMQVFFLGMLVVALFPAWQKEREKEVERKRQEQLLREYPGMVNKLVLLLGAGMTLRSAWRQIVEKYTKEVKKGRAEKSIVYEEMLLALREMESGKSELSAYESFGERCGVQRYRKLSGYLIQNVRKGNKGLCQLLEREVEEAFLERKNMAQQMGEEVGTKLLLPMFLMLGIVIFLIMIPAVISFKTGIN